MRAYPANTDAIPMDTDEFGLMPDRLPPHPRVFVTAADLERGRELVAAGTWFAVAQQRLLDTAAASPDLPDELPNPVDPRINQEALTQAKRHVLAFHLIGEESHYDRALSLFRRIASAYLTWARGITGRRGD